MVVPVPKVNVLAAPVLVTERFRVEPAAERNCGGSGKIANGKTFNVELLLNVTAPLAVIKTLGAPVGAHI